MRGTESRLPRLVEVMWLVAVLIWAAGLITSYAAGKSDSGIVVGTVLWAINAAAFAFYLHRSRAG